MELTHLKKTELLTVSKENCVRIIFQIIILKVRQKVGEASLEVLMPGAKSVVGFNVDKLPFPENGYAQNTTSGIYLKYINNIRKTC